MAVGHETPRIPIQLARGEARIGVLVSPRFVHLSETSSVGRSRLFQSLAHPQVERAAPVYLRYARWRSPEFRERVLSSRPVLEGTYRHGCDGDENQ